MGFKGIGMDGNNESCYQTIDEDSNDHDTWCLMKTLQEICIPWFHLMESQKLLNKVSYCQYIDMDGVYNETLSLELNHLFMSYPNHSFSYIQNSDIPFHPNQLHVLSNHPTETCTSNIIINKLFHNQIIIDKVLFFNSISKFVLNLFFHTFHNFIDHNHVHHYKTTSGIAYAIRSI